MEVPIYHALIKASITIPLSLLRWTLKTKKHTNTGSKGHFPSLIIYVQYPKSMPANILDIFLDTHVRLCFPLLQLKWNDIFY